MERVVDTKSNGDWSLRNKETITLSTFARSPDILKAILREAMTNALDEETGTVSIFVPRSSQEEWNRVTTKPKRDISTVVLEQGNSEKVVNDVKEFLASSDWYRKRGLPWRRGYLLHGPPGCGKSSFLFALASHLDLNLCCLNVSDSGMTDTVLMGLLMRVPKKFNGASRGCRLCICREEERRREEELGDLLWTFERNRWCGCK